MLDVCQASRVAAKAFSENVTVKLGPRALALIKLQPLNPFVKVEVKTLPRRPKDERPS